MIGDFDLIRVLQIAGPTYALMLIAVILLVHFGTRDRKNR